MTRTTMPTAIALTAAAALLLTACGGSGSSSDKIAGAGSATSKSASPSASASTSAGAPTFDLPSDVKMKFDGFESSDATKGAVLRDTSYAITAYVEGKAKGVGPTQNMKRYFTGLHGAEIQDAIEQFAATGMTITGIYHEYQPTVTIVNKKTADVTFCEDQSKAYGKNRKTGAVKTSTPSAKDYSLWSMGLAKNSAGDWQVFRYSTTKGAKQCQLG